MTTLPLHQRFALAALGVALLASLPAAAQERTVKIYGFGAKSGVVRIFGLNSEAAMKAAAFPSIRCFVRE